MSSGIIETIKRVALNVFESSKPVNVVFGEVLSDNPVKIQVGEHLTLTKEFLVINGAVSEGDRVTLIRCQGGQKYIVLGTRTEYIQNNIYMGGGTVVADGSWQVPYRGGFIQSSPFWQKRGNRYHKGVDLVGVNKNIYPVNNGTVVLAGWNGGYGNCVIIDHGNGYWSLYGHFKKLYVKKGQTVDKNVILGLEGSTGNSTGSHLHLEIRKGANSSNNVINPLKFLGVE